MNLLDARLISTQSARLSLPGLLAAMARGEVQSFPALRPHQRPALHMFLVQLAALALREPSVLPEEEDIWRSRLLALTDGDSAQWALIRSEAGPAFLQPPETPGLKWSRVETPDALDMLITSKNHDLKQQVARHASPEDWVFALISLQTMEGYGGAGNGGILRMNGGSSSRPLLGFAPALPDGGGPDPSAWWRRDVARLLALRQTGEGLTYGKAGGPALLWTLPWPEGKQLALTELDPWFVEVCRRIRMTSEGGRLIALRSTSAKTRINSDGVNGVTGDPWAPVSMDKNPRSFTLSGRNFDYALMCELLFSGDWMLPALAQPAQGEAAGWIVSEAFSRGNSKTEGFKSRLVPVPGWARGFLSRPDAGTLARDQVAEIKVFDAALRNGLALISAGGDREKLNKSHFAHSREARDRFDRLADTMFFPSLWARLAAAPGAARDMAGKAFVSSLNTAAHDVFCAGRSTIPCASILRPRAEARARQAFFLTIWRGRGGSADFSFLFAKKESTDDAA